MIWLLDFFTLLFILKIVLGLTAGFRGTFLPLMSDRFHAFPFCLFLFSLVWSQSLKMPFGSLANL